MGKYIINDWRKVFYDKAKDELIYHKHEAYFSWKNCKWKRKKLLQDASFVDTPGYSKIGLIIDGKKFAVRVHTLVYYIETGLLLENLDHIDRNKRNNHISNLREADHSIQNLNRNTKRGIAGEKYIYYEEGKPNPWRVRIMNKHIKNCISLEEAIKVRNLHMSDS